MLIELRTITKILIIYDLLPKNVCKKFSKMIFFFKIIDEPAKKDYTHVLLC